MQNFIRNTGAALSILYCAFDAGTGSTWGAIYLTNAQVVV